MLKNECFIIKKMSFLKISDPLKRDSIVKEYLELKKNIRNKFLSERIGESELQTSLSKFYKPITETQKATTKEITEGLKPIIETQKATAREITEGLRPIREGIEKLPKTNVFPTIQLIGEASGKEEEKEEEKEEKEKEKEEKEKEKEEKKLSETLGETAFKYLHKEKARDRDKTFGIYYGRDGNYRMGIMKGKDGVYRGNNKTISIVYDKIIVDNEEFIGTPGLWELIMEEKPDPKNYTQEDLINYGDLLFKTNAMYEDFNPNNPYPRSSRSYKWQNIISLIWAEKTAGKEFKKKYYQGKGVVVIPSDPNALLERLDLLLASQKAGHTGVRNELVSICDELKRQGVLDMKAYKKLNHIIKK